MRDGQNGSECMPARGAPAVGRLRKKIKDCYEYTREYTIVSIVVI